MKLRYHMGGAAIALLVSAGLLYGAMNLARPGPPEAAPAQPRLLEASLGYSDIEGDRLYYSTCGQIRVAAFYSPDAWPDSEACGECEITDEAVLLTSAGVLTRLDGTPLPACNHMDEVWTQSRPHPTDETDADRYRPEIYIIDDTAPSRLRREITKRGDRNGERKEP